MQQFSSPKQTICCAQLFIIIVDGEEEVVVALRGQCHYTDRTLRLFFSPLTRSGIPPSIHPSIHHSLYCHHRRQLSSSMLSAVSTPHEFQIPPPPPPPPFPTFQSRLYIKIPPFLVHLVVVVVDCLPASRHSLSVRLCTWRNRNYNFPH